MACPIMLLESGQGNMGSFQGEGASTDSLKMFREELQERLDALRAKTEGFSRYEMAFHNGRESELEAILEMLRKNFS